MFRRRRPGSASGPRAEPAGWSRRAGAAHPAEPAQPPARDTGPAAGPHPLRTGRDRHGRGVRGPLSLPGPLAVNGARVSPSRAERFDDLVLDAVEDVESRLSDRLSGVEFAVEDVPELGPDGAVVGAGSAGPPDRVPLGSVFPADADHRARVVVYRRPLEVRALDSVELALIVHRVVVEQVAALLGLSPTDVDPEYGEDDPL